MFSDTWYKADKYNLNTFEYVSTYERMPWRFTSLVDSQYLPSLDSNVSSKLNKLFQYSFKDRAEVLHKDNKYLSIEYVGEEIKAFFSFNTMKYHNLSRVWNEFLQFVDVQDLDKCKERIDRMTDETDRMETDVVGFHYDKDANFTGVRIFDPTYNLAEYSSNTLLNDINSFCKRNKDSLKGDINIFCDTNLLHYTLKLNIPQSILVREDRGYFKLKSDVEPRKEFILNKLLEKNYISEDQKQFIGDTCVGKSTFLIDYVVSESGELVDMYLRHIKVSDFEDLTIA